MYFESTRMKRIPLSPQSSFPNFLIKHYGPRTFLFWILLNFTMSSKNFPARKAWNSFLESSVLTASSKSIASVEKDNKGEKIIEYPPNWKEQLNGIKIMKENRAAPIDLVGINAIAGMLNDVEPTVSSKDKRFLILLAGLMSSQTKVKNTFDATERLKALCYPSPVNPSTLLDKSELEIQKAIKSVRFYKRKASQILQISNICVSKYNGDIPFGDELLALPGIGPKVMTLVVDVAWGEVVGICVDIHVHRVSNRLGWAKTWNSAGSSGKARSQNTEKTRKALEKWLPREHWSEINILMVGFGQEVCKAVAPKCHECPIQAICPSAARLGRIEY